MANAMNFISRTSDSTLKDIWKAQPMKDRVEWWHKHSGMTSKQLRTELEATYREEIKQSTPSNAAFNFEEDPKEEAKDRKQTYTDFLDNNLNMKP